MSNLVLNDFSAYFPKSWKPSTAYENTLYVLHELNQSDEDYANVKSLFSRTPIKIHRVQHPIAFLRYTVHSEFLENEGISYQERLAYFPVARDEINVSLIYNCDSRVTSENSKFVLQPQNLTSDYIVVVNQRISNTETDKNHYPLYAVEFD